MAARRALLCSLWVFAAACEGEKGPALDAGAADSAAPDASPAIDTGARDTSAAPPDSGPADGTPPDGPPPLWIDDVTAPLPPQIAQTGLFEDLSAQQPSRGFVAYEPPFTRWANGAQVTRFVRLPEGGRIDARGPFGWSFPLGTVFMQILGFEQGPVEIRLLVQRQAGFWDYGLYVWGSDGAGATLQEGDWIESFVQVTASDGATFRHTIPARLDCRICHEGAVLETGTFVLGVSDLQQPEALRDRIDNGQAPVVQGRTPEETAAVEYFAGNCVFCHQFEGRGGPFAPFSLLPAVAVQNTVGVPTTTESAGPGVRIVPGDPQASVLYRVTGQAHDPAWRELYKPMPPVAIDRVDPALEPILRSWIEALAP